jgi:hypothetical protein
LQKGRQHLARTPGAQEVIMKITVFSTLIMLSVAALAAPSVLAQTTPAPTTTQPSGAQKKTTPKTTTPEPVQGSFKTEAEAQATCVGAPVVWVNTRSKVYHAKGTRSYGTTKQGFYMCQALADTSGYRAVRASTPKKTTTPTTTPKS